MSFQNNQHSIFLSFLTVGESISFLKNKEMTSCWETGVGARHDGRLKGGRR